MRFLPASDELTIGALASRSGCTVPTIRYYEEIGLIPPASRTPSGHRVYKPAAEELLRFIRRCRDFGFPIEQVRELVALSQSKQRDCTETLTIAENQLASVREKIAGLRALEESLARYAKACAQTCAGGPASQCSIMKGDGIVPPVARSCCG